MQEAVLDLHQEAISHLEKAENYKRLGLQAQVEYELAQAEALEPSLRADPRLLQLRAGVKKQKQASGELKSAGRIAAVLLFTDILVGGLIVFIFEFIAITSHSSLVNPTSFFIIATINLIIGINLWIGRESWQRYTVWWAIFTAVFYGGMALIGSRYLSALEQLAFSGALILLLRGTPSTRKTIFALAVFACGYLLPSLGQFLFALFS